MKLPKNLQRFQIIVPAFNEEESLDAVIQHAYDYGYFNNLLIVDDASTDSTPEILKKWSNNFGLRVIRLQENCKKEGAVKVAMKALQKAGELKPFTLLLDADSMLIGDLSNKDVPQQIEKCIQQMLVSLCKGMAFRIEVSPLCSTTFFDKCAFADYTAMQFDQWLLALQHQLWVINGVGGIFDTNHLMKILDEIEPDFETGDLIITVKLMIDKQIVAFSSGFSVETFVPRDLRSYFNQRRRWERGTTKVLWNERFFYFKLFPGLRLMALSTIIHLSLYLGLITSTVLIILDNITWIDFFTIWIFSALAWFAVSIIKGAIIKITRPDLQMKRFVLCAALNSLLWFFVTSPARLTGFFEAIYQIITGASRFKSHSQITVKYSWVPTQDTHVVAARKIALTE
ncbi:glycosyltransferase [Polynucleobacter sp. MG-Unter2-18]|uniref:glycosyltransferase n=1 Tax=Polynucleobacter sp. MG-Unter2-18 TaxID=2081052 RepID=UPI001BFE9238|nr:glycosyltransferase [Polynucleobacter sp. MG-Unter2-18]QWD95360.1 glycosyltransferase [Polynucleobacter sp. MG-Unter2-18]